MRAMPLYALEGERPRIHPRAYVHPDAVLIGPVLLAEEATVWPGVVIRADNGPIRIGARSSVQDGTVIHTQPHNPTSIGNDCVIGHLVHLEGCTIEDDVLVGSGAVVLEEAVCRAVSFVAAGALVPPRMEVPSRAMAIGVPARLREGTVTKAMVAGNVQAYLHHLRQHRDDTVPVELADCVTDDIEQGAGRR